MTTRTAAGSHRAASWTRGPLGALVVIAVCLAAHWPGLFALPPVDRDESRFAQASRQVLAAAREGDVEGVAVPRIQDRPRLNKPPLVYWLQAAVAWPYDPAPADDASADPRRQSIGVYRMVSALCAMAACLLTWRIGCLLYRRSEGLIAAVMLATCVMVLWDARQARADQLLLATTTLAMLALAHLYLRGRAQRSNGALTLGWRGPVLLWIAVGLGVLAKGPITPMVVVLASLMVAATLGWWRWLRALRPLTGLGVVLAMVLPWVIVVGRSVGFGEYFALIADETLGRAGAAKESHWGPPGYHLVLLPVLLWPGSLLTALALGRAWRRARRRAHPARMRRFRASPELFLLAWIVPSWIVFELSMTKLPHYTLPLYPALALLTARALAVAARAGLRVPRVGVAIWGLIGAALLIGPLALVPALGSASWLDDFAARPLGVWGHAALVVAMVCVVVGLTGLARGGKPRRAALWAAAAAAIWVGVLVGVRLPSHRALWGSSEVAAAIAGLDPDAERPLARVGYHEDSLVFLTRGRAERVSKKGLGAWLAEHPGGLAVVDAAVLEALEPSLSRFSVVWEGLEGGFLNYSTGEWVDLAIVASPSGAGGTAGAR